MLSQAQCLVWQCPPTMQSSHPPGCRRLVSPIHSIRRTRSRCSAATASRQLANVDEIQKPSHASLLAIGTANPVNCVRQDDYTDWYFRVTGSDHLENLKAKMKRMCDKSGIKKRYFHHSEKTIRDHPILLGQDLPSLDARQDMLAVAVPELAAAAAEDAIAEWGRPVSDITHLVVSTYSGAHMPGADLRLASLLGLRPSVHRTMLYHQGCTAGSAVLRVAKDIAENNPGARVLVACAELTLVLFRAPEVESLGTVIMQTMFGDGASAAVVGADADEPVERPLFEMVAASQAVIPEMTTCDSPAATGHLTEAGFVFHPSKTMPALVRRNIERCVADGLAPLGLGGSGWNDLFWAVQPGGRGILDAVEAGLALEPAKLEASRRVLREYGYMSGASMLFVLDELRRRGVDGRCDAAAGGLGMMVGIGPGISLETMVLRAAPRRE